MQYKLGFLGAGVMAGAILDKVLLNINGLEMSAEELAVYDIDKNKVAAFAAKGVSAIRTAEELFATCEIVLLGVKPQFYADILSGIKDYGCKTVISIMAGVKIATLRKLLGDTIGIVRVMPNTPCKIGEGMSALAFNKVIQPTALWIKKMFSSCGKVLELAEENFDAVTSISGSGPAYVYLFADGLIKGGIEGGLTPEDSKTLALQTIIGAAKLAATDETALDVLVDRVCSKGGTTIEAVNYYRETGLTDIIKEGVKRCRQKSEYLSNKL